MSLETENLRSSGNGSEKLGEASKKIKFSYTRKFLLSLSDLDVCKKVPSDFDESLLGEFEDSAQSLQDRSTVFGSHHFQGFRRNDHGSSPPSWWDSANLSGGTYGKTGSRSSVQSDRDSDSQSDRDSESGKHYSQQSRRSWHSTEHDGLLGSGSGTFSRLTGCAPGISAPKNKTNDSYQLKKSNEPYHPPRPYKAVPYSKRDIESNDETFGSSECISEDRAEEERRRRASFEQMRKEQQKALQEKQNLNLENKVNDVPELALQHENKKEELETFIDQDNLQVLAAGPSLKNPSGKYCHTLSSSSAYRPLVPPGFRNSAVERTPEMRSDPHNASLEVGKISTEEGTLDSETSFQYGTTVLKPPTEQKSEAESQLPSASSGHLGCPEILKLGSQVTNDKAVVNSNSGDSSSLMERILWGPASFDRQGVSSLSEDQRCKPSESWSPGFPKTSKFAQGFLEEAKTAGDLSSGRPADILSLIVSGDKSRYPGSETAEQCSDNILLNNFELPRKLPSSSFSAADVANEQTFVNSKGNSIPTILTCEDLENSILTEYSAQTTDPLPPSNSWSTYGDVEPLKEHVDANASVHLLSLLQKNTDQSKSEISVEDINLGTKPLVSQDMVAPARETKGNGKNVVNSENKLTLEMLFGSAFMKELQSVEAPVSVQRGLSGSAEVQAPEPPGIAFSSIDSEIFSSEVDGINFESIGKMHGFSHKKQTEPSSGNLLGYHDSKLSSLSSHARDVSEYGGLEDNNEFQMREHSSISSTGPRGYQMLASMPVSSINNEHFSGNSPVDLVVDRQLRADAKNVVAKLPLETMVSRYVSYENMEPGLPHHGLPMQHPSPQFQHLPMAPVRPLHDSTESPLARLTSQVEVLGQKAFYNHDSVSANRHFPSTVRPFQDLNVGIPRFNVPSHHPPLQHQMQMPGNNSSHMMTDLRRVGIGSFHGNQETGLHQESNSNFPFPVQELDLGRRLASAPGTGVIYGNNPPEAFQRLVEMEKSAHHLKQARQFGAPGHKSQGIHWT